MRLLAKSSMGSLYICESASSEAMLNTLPERRLGEMLLRLGEELTNTLPERLLGEVLLWLAGAGAGAGGDGVGGDGGGGGENCGGDGEELTNTFPERLLGEIELRLGEVLVFDILSSGGGVGERQLCTLNYICELR